MVVSLRYTTYDRITPVSCTVQLHTNSTTADSRLQVRTITLHCSYYVQQTPGSRPGPDKGVHTPHHSLDSTTGMLQSPSYSYFPFVCHENGAAAFFFPFRIGYLVVRRMAHSVASASRMCHQDPQFDRYFRIGPGSTVALVLNCRAAIKTYLISIICSYLYY